MFQQKSFILILLVCASWGSLAEINGINDVCNKPELLARLPDYMKESCKVIKDRARTIDIDNNAHQIIDQGFRNGSRYRDVIPFPPGSTWGQDDKGNIVVYPPRSNLNDTFSETTTAS